MSATDFLDHVQRLTEDEKRELPTLILAGREGKTPRAIRQGNAAEQRWVEGNLRLAVSIAGKYPEIGCLQFEDMIQEGVFGLMRATQSFDFEAARNTSKAFSTYAYVWIRKYIGQAISNQAPLIRLPEWVRLEARRAYLTRTNLADVLGSSPSDADVAADMGIPVERVRHLDHISQIPISLSSNPSSELDNDIDVPVHEDTEDEERSLFVQDLLSRLTPHEAEIVTMRAAGIGKDRVAKAMRTSPARIGRLEASALLKLRKEAA